MFCTLGQGTHGRRIVAVARSSTSVPPTPESSLGRPMRVLRIHQSGVVGAWRGRDRGLRARGINLTLVSAVRWNEGGADVRCEPAADDDFVVTAATLGRRPNLFAYDPRPLWKVLRRRPFDLIDA